MEYMSNPKRIIRFAQFEFTRFLLSKRGMIATLGFSALWLIVLNEFVARAVDLLQNPGFKDFVQQAFGFAGMSRLLEWPVAEMTIYWLVAMSTFPLFAIFAASDQLCSDKQRGTIRFLALRASRFELMLGRFIGQVGVIATMILITLIAVMVMASLRDASMLVPGFEMAAMLFVKLNLVVLPFIAMMTLFNSYLTSSKQAIIHFILCYALVSIFFSLLSHYVWNDLDKLMYIMPNSMFSEVLSLRADFSVAVLMPILQTMAYLGLAYLIIRKKAI